MQRTCLLIKPDGIEKKVVGKIIERFEREGFDLLAIKTIQPNRKLMQHFYSMHKGKPFFPFFIEFMLTGQVIAMVWAGENIIERSRKMIGDTNSKTAEKNTLRKLYGTDSRRNLIHGSDSERSARREINLLFEKKEIDPKE